MGHERQVLAENRLTSRHPTCRALSDGIEIDDWFAPDTGTFLRWVANSPFRPFAALQLSPVFAFGHAFVGI